MTAANETAHALTWAARTRRRRAVRLDSGADERGEYVRVALVKAESVTVFGERR